MASFWWALLTIVIFYFFLVIIDTTVFHNKLSDITKAFKNKIFLFLFAFTIVLGVLYFVIWHELLPAVLFVMYAIFISKLVVKKM